MPFIAITNCLLASGRGYKSGETTIANVGRICTVRSVGISVDINPFEPHILASNMAHAIGHNLGFAHDDRSGGSPSGQYSKYAYNNHVLWSQSTYRVE
jgi:hypothetical protein